MDVVPSQTASAESCVELINEINEATSKLLGDDTVFFKASSLSRATRGCAELMFLRNIFWLSGVFHECCGKPLRYCCRQSQFGSQTGTTSAFLETLGALRTHAAHNLDKTSDRDQQTDYICKKWYQLACGHFLPYRDEQWSACNLLILKGSVDLLSNLSKFLKVLQNLADADLLIEGLTQAIRNQWSPYAFDEILNQAARDMGRTKTNLVQFRVAHLSKWMSQLEKLPEGYDFATEARILIDQSLIAKPEPPPVSGRDIIAALGISPGPEVARQLQLATQLHNEGVIDKKEILSRLRLNLLAQQ